MKKIFIAVPIFENFKADSKHSLEQLIDWTNKNTSLCQVTKVKELYGESLISRARNNLAFEFLDSGEDYLLFYDSDIVCSTLAALHFFVEHNPLLIGGVYIFKNPPYQPAVRMKEKLKSDFSNFSLYDFRGITTPLKARYISSGFMLIDKIVVRRLVNEYKYPFMPMTNNEGEYLSEDWAFCERYFIKYGYNPYILPSIKLYHLGIYAYGLNDFYTTYNSKGK